MIPSTQRLLTNLESWSITASKGRQYQKGFSNMRPANANPVKYYLPDEFEIAKYRSSTFSGSCLSLMQKKRAERASKRVKYFLPGRQFTPNSTISSFWMVRGSFSNTTFCSKVRGQAMAPPVYGLLTRFQRSRLISSVLMHHLTLLSNRLIIRIIIIAITMIVSPIAVILLILMANGQTEDFLRFWPPDASFLQPAHSVSRALFVTSWNPVSRKVALQHASKFQSIILCLYDLHFNKDRFWLQNLVKIESSFLQELRQINPEIRAFLRVFMMSSARSLFEYVGSSTKKIAEVASTIVRVMRREKTNGVYFDSSFNLPIIGTAAGPYDKFAALLNGVALGIRTADVRSVGGDEGVADVDLAALKQIKADALIVEALESPHSLSHALKFVHQVRGTGDEQPMDYFIAVPLFSWRNGIGVRTPLVRGALQKNGVTMRGFKNGLCAYVEQVGGAESIVPCEHYFQVVRKYASEVGVKLAFFQAGDAIDAMFDMI